MQRERAEKEREGGKEGREGGKERKKRRRRERGGEEGGSSTTLSSLYLYYQDADMWTDAMRIVKDYLPHKLDDLQHEMAARSGK